MHDILSIFDATMFSGQRWIIDIQIIISFYLNDQIRSGNQLIYNNKYIIILQTTYEWISQINK